jgi:hypothetical protein
MEFSCDIIRPGIDYRNRHCQEGTNIPDQDISAQGPENDIFTNLNSLEDTPEGQDQQKSENQCGYQRPNGIDHLRFRIEKLNPVNDNGNEEKARRKLQEILHIAEGIQSTKEQEGVINGGKKIRKDRIFNKWSNGKQTDQQDQKNRETIVS